MLNYVNVNVKLLCKWSNEIKFHHCIGVKSVS